MLDNLRLCRASEPVGGEGRHFVHGLPGMRAYTAGCTRRQKAHIGKVTKKTHHYPLAESSMHTGFWGRMRAVGWRASDTTTTLSLTVPLHPPVSHTRDRE